MKCKCWHEEKYHIQGKSCFHATEADKYNSIIIDFSKVTCYCKQFIPEEELFKKPKNIKELLEICQKVDKYEKEKSCGKWSPDGNKKCGVNKLCPSCSPNSLFDSPLKDKEPEILPNCNVSGSDIPFIDKRKVLY